MIAVDWGTTSFRAWRLDDAGAVQERRAAAAGLQACRGAFADVLAAQIAGWDDPLVVMSGMVGSRAGWREVPYVSLPAGLDEIAAGMLALDAAALPGRDAWIVPGLAVQVAGVPPDVMRGEETQVLGLLDQLPPGTHWIGLPGTHSKWVCVEAGRIVSLATAMTGELYALLRRHSLLAALMPEDARDDADDPEAYAQGLAAATWPGGLNHHLFGVRTRGLFGQLAPAAAPSYLSGLLIGHELRELLPQGVRSVHLVGGAALAERYRRALASAGVAAQVHDEALGARGLHRLARTRGVAARRAQ